MSTYRDLYNKLTVPDKHRALLYFPYFKNRLDRFTEEKLEFSSAQIDIVDVLQDLILELDSLVAPTIAYEIARARQQGLLKGITPHDRYASFFVEESGRRTKVFVDSLQAYKDALRGYIYGLIDNTFNNLEEALVRLHRDRFMLARPPFHIGPHDHIVRVKPLGGDRHNSGRVPLLMMFQSGEKVVYKPCIVNPEGAIRVVLEKLETGANFGIYIPHHLNRSGYCWAQFVEKREADSLSAITSYYYRAGVLASILDFMLFVDGNEENVIAVSETPVLVDIETIFHPEGSTALSTSRNVLATGLFRSGPRRELEFSDTRRVVFAGAFSIPTAQRTNPLTPVVVADGTDNIHIRFTGAPAPEAESVPHLKGQPRYPQQFVDHILKGYWEGSGIISGLTMGDVRELIASISREGCTARVILRPTAFYGSILKAMQQPRYLKLDKARRLDVVRRFLLAHKAPIPSEFVVEQELSDLARLDVPYFFADCFGTKLCSPSGACAEDYFDEPPIHGMLPSWKRFTTEYREAALSMIKQAVLDNSVNSDG